jgi:hypothetical protein
MVLVYYWVQPYLYEELFSMSCIVYVTQTTDGYEEQVTHSKASSQGYTEENQKYCIADLMKYLDKLFVGYECRSITTAS